MTAPPRIPPARRKGERWPKWSKLLSKAQLVALLEGPRKEGASRDFYLLTTVFYFGLRAGEAVMLRTEHFDLGRRELRVPTEKKRRTKHGWDMCPSTGKPLLPVPFLGGAAQELVVRRLLRWGEGREWLFPGVRNRPMTTRGARAVFARWAKRAGLHEKYHLHSLRHTAGSMLYNRTKDILLVRDFLRHSSVETTDTYLHSMASTTASGALSL